MENNSASGGVGFTGLLTILFIALKLCGVISWSWVWVLSPLWISFGICLVILVIAFTAYGIKVAKRNKKMLDK
jgi:Flp pilus assembly protein TadB